MCPRSFVAVLLGLFLVGCSADWYKERADTQTYRIVADTQKEQMGVNRPLSIEPPVAASTELQAVQPLKTGPELKDAMGRPAPPPEALLMEGEGESGAAVPQTPAAPEAQPAPSRPTEAAPAAGEDPAGEDPAAEKLEAQPAASQPAEVAPAAGGKPDVQAAPAQPGPVSTSEPSAARPAETVVELQPTVADKFALLEQAGEPLPVPESARVLGLADALLLASRHNRDYLSQQESLYLSALSLTLEQHLWSPRFRAVLSSDIARTGDIPRNTPWDAAGQLGMALNLPDGGNVDMSMNTGLAGDFSTNTPETAVSTWVTSITQPLLRGFGRTIAQEPLVQAERNVIYAVRTFERYRRTFAVQVASDFFRALQLVDAVRNQWENYQRFIDVRKMTQALADAGRVPAFQVDQARQDELSARNSWVTSVETYEVALDRFKIELGLSTEVAIVLDYRELDTLRQLGAAPPEESPEQATAIALANRLDLMVERDQLADAGRRANIAQDQLRGDLSFTASASVESATVANQPLNAQFHEGTYRAGVDYNLPVDRFAERNRYRQALISLEQQRRSVSLAQDTVVLEVRDAYRGVQQAMESYRIQQISLDLARRRVESTSLLLRAGRATTRDLLESQNAYVDAQNRLTQALVDLSVARLELRRDMDVLEIDEKGAWSWPQVTSLETGEAKHE